MDLQGHLVVLVSEEENLFVRETFPGDWLWLGGYQEPSDWPISDEQWFWITGEPWEYVAWNSDSGEPNDADGDECRLQYHGAQLGWNDQEAADLNFFIVEYETEPVPAREASWGTIKGLFLD